jgi:tetratricopeptide (TPR) repeat protein
VSDIGPTSTCAKVREHIERVLDGDTDELGEELSTHLLDCDDCRDFRHEAEQAAEMVSMAGADYVEPRDMLERVLGKIDALDEAGPEGLAPKTSVSEASAPGADAAAGARDGGATDAPTAALVESAPPQGAEAETPNSGTKLVQLAAKDAAASQVDAVASQVAAEDATKTSTAPGSEGSGPEERHEAKEGKASAGVLVALRTPKGRQRARQWGAVGIAAAAVIALWLGDRGSSPNPEDPIAEVHGGEPWAGRVAEVVRGFGSRDGLSVCEAPSLAAPASDCRPIASGDEIDAGAVLRTDSVTQARLELHDGTLVVLDRQSEFRLDAEQARHGSLRQGEAVFDVRRGLEQLAVVDVPQGRVEVLGTKFVVYADSDTTRVDVSRGEVRLVDHRDRDVAVGAGQTGRLRNDDAPRVDSVSDLSESFAWSERAFGTEEEAEESPRGLGELRAKKPGERDELNGAVVLTKHAVKVRIQETMARTEVEEVFENRTDERLEGIFRFPLPPDAQIERLALEVDGHMEEGAFVDRERAAAIWRGAIVNSSKRPKPIQEEIVWVPGPWRDPALLEWQSGGRFELRIFPIEKRSSRRVILTYTQKLSPRGDAVGYTYPLAHDPSGSTKVLDFSFEAEVRGHAGAVTTRGYDFEATSSGLGADVLRRSLTRRDFVPAGDIGLDFRLADAGRELKAWAYEGSDGGPSYVALALRPNLPLSSERQERAYVFVVDRSRSMYGEQFDRARKLVVHTIRELDHDALVGVIDCDTECSAFSPGLRPVTEGLAGDVERYLSQVRPEGASDLVASLRAAVALRREAGGRKLEIVYVGDGAPTVGEVHPAFVGEAIRRVADGDVRVSAVTVGTGADLGALAAATRAGGGVVIPFVPGQSVGEAAFALLGATYGGALADVRVTLPEGLSDVAPREIGTVLAGDELVVVARMSGGKVDGEVTLSGKVGGESFEKRYELELEATGTSGNAFVPRLFAAARIADLEQEVSPLARERAVELSQKFNVASRHTSLLVLESPAMFKAFGLDNERTTPVWTGEADATSVEAGDLLAEEERATTVSGRADPSNPYGGSAEKSSDSSGQGLGSLSGRRAARAPGFAPPPAAAPKPKKEAAEREPWPSAAEDAARQPTPPPQFFDDEPMRDRRMVPMRKVWDRVMTVDAGGKATVSEAELDKRRARLEANPLNREALKQLYAGYLLGGELDRAEELAQRWSDKDPLDPDALTARADLAAQRGDRKLALRILGSVVDVRPSDHQAHFRLARALRWAGESERGCRHTFADAQRRINDGKALADAVRCLRESDQSNFADDLLRAAPGEARTEAERSLSTPASLGDELSGDFRIEAVWEDGSEDLDLVIVHPEGYRVSWLGAPTRSVITATDVLSSRREGLALRGAPAGDYAIEVVRADGDNRVVRGEAHIRVGNQSRTVPFSVDGARTRIATVKVSMRSRLVPL